VGEKHGRVQGFIGGGYSHTHKRGLLVGGVTMARITAWDAAMPGISPALLLSITWIWILRTRVLQWEHPQHWILIWPQWCYLMVDPGRVVSGRPFSWIPIKVKIWKGLSGYLMSP